MQNLKPWLPAPPRMRSAEEAIEVEPVADGLSSTAISSQDGPEPVSAPVEPSGGTAADDEAPVVA